MQKILDTLGDYSIVIFLLFFAVFLVRHYSEDGEKYGVIRELSVVVLFSIIYMNI